MKTKDNINLEITGDWTTDMMIWAMTTGIYDEEEDEDTKTE